MQPTILVRNLTLEYRATSKRRLIPGFRRKGALKPLEGKVGGDFILSRNDQVVRSLDNVSFSLQRGDRLGLIGTNGAGKSTLLMVLAGIYPPTSGSVDVNGRIDALFNIGLGFRPEATGRRNIILRGLINGWSPELIEAKMDSIIEFSELGKFIDMPFKSYSQGMAARLAFSIATAVTPDILLLDEWIGAGDIEFQNKAQERMTSLVNNASTMIIASHNHSLLKQVCTKVMRLEHGRITAFGDPEELL